MRTCPSCGESNSPTARFCQACGTQLPAIEQGESRKLATLLFCDVSGSTELGESLDPEVLRRLITNYFESMAAVIAKHGGTVEKFIGDAVMAVFGVPVTHEDDALRAARAAWEMRELMRHFTVPGADGEGPALQVRIGLNTGEVLAGDPSAGHGFVSGDAVNVAARLEQAAPPGEVLMGESTFRVVRDHVRADPVEPLTVKGKSAPLQAYQLIAIRRERRSGKRAVVVGRTEQLDRLAAAFDKMTRDDRLQWTTILGPPGSGKTALLQTFLARVAKTTRVMQGHCLSYGEGITFWPVAEAIRGAAGIVEEDPKETAVSKLQELIGDHPDRELVAQRLSAALGLSDEATTAQEIFWAFRSLLEHLAGVQPIVLVLEDLHWAEPTLLDLIEYLASFSEGLRVMLVAVGRPELMEQRPAWLGRSDAISLGPLLADDVGAVVGSFMQGEVAPEIVTHVYRASDGNPLYVEELTKMMLEENLVEERDGTWVPRAELSQTKVPATVQALLTSRLERLPYEEQAAVQGGSVIGEEFWSGALTVLTTEDLRAHIGRALQSLVRKEMLLTQRSELAGEDEFRFAHVLLKDAAYNGLPKQRRAELHERVADWLVERAGNRLLEYEEVLAYHLHRAAQLRLELGMVGEKTTDLQARAGSTLATAGKRAFIRGDLPASIGMLERGAAILPAGAASAPALWLSLSEALTEAGRLTEATEAAATALSIATEQERKIDTARARIQISALLGLTDHDAWVERASKELPAALEEMETLDDDLGRAKALLQLAEFHWDHLRMSQAQTMLEQALPLARKASDIITEGKILGFLAGAALWGPMHVDAAIALCEDIRSSASNNQGLQAKALSSLACLYAMRGEKEKARELSSEGARLQRELGQHLALAYSSQYRGVAELLANEPEGAAAELERGFRLLEEMKEQAYLPTQAALLARAQNQAGRHDEAYEMTLRAEEASDGDEATFLEWAPTRARVLAVRGELDAAGELAARAVSSSTDKEDVFSVADALVAAGEILILRGHVAEAHDHLQRAEALYRTKGIVSWADAAAELRRRSETTGVN